MFIVSKFSDDVRSQTNSKDVQLSLSSIKLNLLKYSSLQHTENVLKLGMVTSWKKLPVLIVE